MNEELIEQLPEKPDLRPPRPSTRRTLSTFLLLFAVAAAIITPLLYVSYSSQMQAVRGVLHAHQRKQAALQERAYKQHFQNVVSDLRFLAELDELAALLTEDAASSEHVGNTLTAFVRRKPGYAELRLLDDSGAEVMRVDGGRMAVRPPLRGEQQDKAYRSYFEKAAKLEAGQVYVSPIRLRVQHGQVQDPPNPLMHFATPVEAAAGTARGVLMLHVRGTALLREVRGLYANTPGRPLLLNGAAYYIEGPDRERRWGFMYGDEGGNWTLAEDDPAAWAAMQAGETGQVYTEAGLYTFTTLYPQAVVRRAAPPDMSGRRDEPAVDPAGRWVIASFVSQSALAVRMRPVRAIFTWTSSFVAGLVIVFAWLGARFYNLRHSTRYELQRANRSLSDTVEDLRRSYREIALINELEDFLQSCNTMDELYKVVQQFCERLFPHDSGALYIHLQQEALLTQVLCWGEGIEQEVHVPEESCWAFRRDQVHVVNEEDTSLLCSHQHAVTSGGALCLPMGAKGELIGMLHIKRENRATPDASPGFRRSMGATIRLANGLAEHIAMTVTNIRLRDELRAQSIRDSLTELFNRRYMEETLHREWHRAQRQKTPLALVSLDVDHFKKLNDTYGHEAGDHVLAVLGRLLREKVRKEDVPCRYGGEEFIVILPGAEAGVAEERAEVLRCTIEQLCFSFQGQSVGITVSIGVVAYPDHGHTTDALVSAADEALYAAKNAGRNRVVVAHAPGGGKAPPGVDVA
ncbi:MAG: diguanylate cyclase [Candidatus Hydrogenedentota bacterium]